MNKQQHFLIISCGSQGHINPTFQLAKRLLHAGADQVTFVSSVRAINRIRSLVSLQGLSYATFSEGNLSGTTNFVEELRRAGSESLRELLDQLDDEGRRVTFLIYTLLLPWAAKVAQERGIPSTFLCIQSAAALVLYDRWFSSGDDMSPLSSIELPGFPSLTVKDVPTFLLPDDQYHSVSAVIREHMELIHQGGEGSCVLVNTFDGLEENLLKALSCTAKAIAIGPLVPLACTTTNEDSLDTSFGCDLFDSDPSQYLSWLDSQAESSVVYVSFGSLLTLNKIEIRSTFDGLVESGKPFLWVIRPPESVDEKEAFKSVKHEVDDSSGLIVPWCSQLEVLNHPSVGCFVTHCGWNSTIEGLMMGVPMVGCPYFSDQTTNATMIQEVCRTGVRAMAGENGIIAKDEIRQCIETVMVGYKAEEMRHNARRWKALAAEAAKEGGPSDNNLRKFMDGLPLLK